MWNIGSQRELPSKHCRRMRTHHPHANVSSPIMAHTCILRSLHKEPSQQTVSTRFKKSPFRTHGRSRQGLHQCSNLPQSQHMVLSHVITPDMTKEHLCNDQAHSTRSSTITLHHFARTEIYTSDILGSIYDDLCKRPSASMHDEHVIQKILTPPAASPRMI